MKRRLLQALLIALFSLFSVLSATAQIRSLLIVEEAFSSESDEELDGEEATLARAPSVARKSAERAHSAAPQRRPRRARTAQLRSDAERHRARVAAYEPPARSPPFRLLN